MATKYIKLKRTQRPKPKKAAFYVTARVFRGNDSFLARVPGAMTTIPEVPEVILIDDWAYKLTNTSPLTYVNVLAAVAKRVK